MRNLKTNDPETPTLLHYTSQTFVIALYSHMGIEELEDDFLTDYPQLQGFITFQNPITKLRPATFRGAENLKMISIFQTNLDEIEHAFQGLHRLLELRLSENSLITINATTFSGLVSLSYLDLSSNRIKAMHENSLQGLTSLKMLQLAANELSEFHPMLDTRYLVRLELQSNKIASLNFPTPVSIDVLNLTNNELEVINTTTFKGVMSAKLITLMQNPLKEIKEGAFQSLTSLQILALGCCDQKGENCRRGDITIRSKAFKSSLNLQEFGIFGCVSTIGNGAFKSLDIEEFFVHFNPQLQRIGREMFSGVKRIGLLDMQANGIQTIDAGAFSNIAGLQNISLGFNNLKTVESNWFSTSVRIKELLLSNNQIQSINGSHLSIMKNLALLDLTSNKLQKLPSEIQELKNTKILVEGNQFNCKSCSQVHILETIKKGTPQHILCKYNEAFEQAEHDCNLELMILLPAVVLVLAVSSILALYFLLRYKSVKGRKEKYDFKVFKLSLKSSKHEFQNEKTLLGEINHPNILKIFSHKTMWVPKRIGLLFYEKTHCTLRERLGRARMGDQITNKVELIKQLFSGLQHIHTRLKSICHLHLSLDSIFIIENDSDQTSTVKIGDFSKAQITLPGYEESADSTSDLVELDHSPMPINSPDDDMKASANIVHSILTSEETEAIENADLEQIPDVEFRVLILALKNGLTASDALQSPAMHSVGERVENINKLNEKVEDVCEMNQEKAKTGEAADERLFKNLEENAEIVLENQSTWFEKLHPSLKSTYGSFGSNGYMICLVRELLRFCRNAIAHSGHNPEAMEQALGTREPTNQQVLNYFSTRFPLFYSHIFHAFRKETLSPAEFAKDANLKEYKMYENLQWQLKQQSGDLVPLQKNNSIQVQFEDNAEKVTLFMKPEKIDQPYTVIPGQLVIEAMKKESTRIWPDTPFQMISLKDDNGSTIQSASRIIEGSIITIRRQPHD